MTPEARHRRRIRTPVLAVTVVAWAAILVPELLGSPRVRTSGGTTLTKAAAESHGHAGHVGSSPSSTGLDVSVSEHWSFTPWWGSATG